MKSKTWLAFVFTLSLMCLVSSALLNFFIDPCFYYRPPSDKIHFYLDGANQRYQNNGILKQFSYDALITGTSMTENFKTSEFDEIFGVNSIKAPLSGGSYKEIDDCVSAAIQNNKKLNIIIRSLDLSTLGQKADHKDHSLYPEYLFDNNIFNDINYILNSDIMNSMSIHSVIYTLSGHDPTSFDEYSNWNSDFMFGKKEVLSGYNRISKQMEVSELSDDEKETVRENVRKNVAENVKNNPDIEFYYFISPYSIVYWDDIVRHGYLNKIAEMQKILIEEIVDYENLHLFSWCDDETLICNLDNYKDGGHYGEWVNSEMLHWMHDGKGMLTKENYKEYLFRLKNEFENYDYESLFE